MKMWITHNKCNNSTKIKLSNSSKQCKIWENHNYYRKLIRLNEFMDYSSRCLLVVQRKTRKCSKEVEECSKQRIKLFKQTTTKH